MVTRYLGWTNCVATMSLKSWWMRLTPEKTPIDEEDEEEEEENVGFT